MNAPPEIELSGVSRRFGGTWAVSDLSLTLPPGEVVGLVGPNGSGKTTTIRLMLGLIRPTAGQVRIDGRPLAGGPDAIDCRLGALVERPAFYGWLTAQENLRHLGGLRFRVTPEEVSQALETVGLAAHRDRAVAGFSTGMQQRLAVALALLGQPRLIVLDEPTSGLDPEFRVIVRDMLRRIRESRQATVLVSSHLLWELEAVCGTVALLREGRAVLSGRLDELLRAAGPARFLVRARPSDTLGKACREALPGARVVDQPTGVVVHVDPEAIPGLIAKLVAQRFSLLEVREELPTLEDLYVSTLRTPSGPAEPAAREHS
jgi:ABC-2 type transport system ATP-binding protein